MAVDPIAAEARAVEAGAYAIMQEDGSFRVRSFSRADVRHIVHPEIVKMVEDWAVRFRCSCESGTSRPGELVPCQHAALVGRRLERDGWAVWRGGYWYATDKALEQAGIRKAPPLTPRIARGACPVCHVMLTLKVNEGETRAAPELAADHKPECAATFAERRARAKERGDIDLWERDPLP